MADRDPEAPPADKTPPPSQDASPVGSRRSLGGRRVSFHHPGKGSSVGKQLTRSLSSFAYDDPAEEGTALLSKAKGATIVTNESEAEDIRQHFDYPDAKTLTVMQIGMGFGYSAYMLTAWLYASIQKDDLFQDCSKTWPHSPEMADLCSGTILLFWTFPLFCCIFLLIFFYRDLLHTRLYFEFLAHRVFLDFRNVGFTESRAVRLMIFWMFAGMLMYPTAGNISLRAGKMTMPYWIPVLSFGGMLFSYWDLETRLLSLAKFVEGDVDWAKRHFRECFFMRDFVAKKAFQNLELHASAQDEDGTINVKQVHATGTLINAITDEAIRMAKAGDMTGFDKEDEGMFAAWLNTYWVTQLLYSPALQDGRANTFRRWFRCYLYANLLFMLFLFYLTFCTVITHLRMQGTIPSSWLTETFTVSHFAFIKKPA